MRRVVVILALLALVLPMAAWAGSITVDNQTGTIAVSNPNGGNGTIGLSTITSKGSELTQFSVGTTTVATGYLGTVSFSTGTLASGSLATGATLNGGGSFIVTGVGKWTQTLSPAPAKGKVTLFSGSFVGPIDWTVTTVSKTKRTATLTGNLAGVLWDGVDVTGTTEQQFYFYNNQWVAGVGHLTIGTASLSTPEPGTLGLLGTGLLGIAGMFRRKLMGS
jgi:hypothetical protein